MLLEKHENNGNMYSDGIESVLLCFTHFFFFFGEETEERG